VQLALNALVPVNNCSEKYATNGTNLAKTVFPSFGRANKRDKGEGKMKKENIIYHYCGLEAFHSIITTKSFWLFSLNSSSDLKEMNEATRILNKVLNEEKYKSINKFNNSRQDEFYSLSCTSKRDSALHFNKYADNDKGVCFGIDTEVFRKYLKNTSLMDLYFGYFFFPKVIYDDNQKEREIKKYLEERLRYIEQPEKTNAKELFEMLIDDVYSDKNKDILRKLTYTTVLSRFKPKLKIINYKDESETRMLFCRSQFQLYKNTFKDESGTNNSSNNFYNAMVKPATSLNIDGSPKFKVISGVIRKYMELEMEKIWDKQPIKEVVLGPNCKTKIEECNEFLGANKVSCNAVESEIKNRK
jgi:hypothetical protein